MTRARVRSACHWSALHACNVACNFAKDSASVSSQTSPCRLIFGPCFQNTEETILAHGAGSTGAAGSMSEVTLQPMGSMPTSWSVRWQQRVPVKPAAQRGQGPSHRPAHEPGQTSGARWPDSELKYARAASSDRIDEHQSFSVVPRRTLVEARVGEPIDWGRVEAPEGGLNTSTLRWLASQPLWEVAPPSPSPLPPAAAEEQAPAVDISEGEASGAHGEDAGAPSSDADDSMKSTAETTTDDKDAADPEGTPAPAPAPAPAKAPAAKAPAASTALVPARPPAQLEVHAARETDSVVVRVLTEGSRMRLLATCALPDGSMRACIVPEGSDAPLGWLTTQHADGKPTLRRAWSGPLYEALIPLKVRRHYETSSR